MLVKLTVPLFGTEYCSRECYPQSGNSPVIWCFISSILYDCYDKQAFKAVYHSRDKSKKVELGMVGSLMTPTAKQIHMYRRKLKSSHSRQTAVHRRRTNAQIWSNLLSTTAGALELNKCLYHVMAWQFTAGAELPVLITDSGKYIGHLS